MPIRTDLLFEHFPGYERGFKPAERFVQDLDHALGAGPIRNVGEGFGDRFPEEKGPYPVREPIVFDCGDKRVPTAEILAAMGNVKPVPTSYVYWLMGQQNVGHALQTMLLGDDEMNVFLAEEVVIEDKKPVLRRCWLHVSLNKGHWYVGVAPFPALDKNERRRYFALKV